ncbi:MAG: hypothetical protein JNM77_08745 [Pseudonocardia sp.]|nr:hypothetical protein [Pseudonocardia sp.]
MALAVTTSPAHADSAANASTVTTASFNVPAGALLAVCVTANTTTGGTTTLTVSTSDGKTLTQRVLADRVATTFNGLSTIYTAAYPSAATGVTVTVTTAGSDSLNREPSVDVFVVTGADLGNPVASSGASGSATNAPSFSPTSTVANSLSIVAASEWQKRGVPVTATGFDVVRNFDQPSGGGISGSVGYKLWGAVGSQSYALDAFGTSSAAWNISRIELRPAVAPTVSAGADVPAHTEDTALTRTATEPSDGGQAITSRSWTIVSGPAGVGTTIGTAAALSWTPATPGSYVLRYSATNSIGTGTDDVAVEVIEAYAPDGVPWLTEALGADARLAVEVAWAADLTDASGSGWAWSDITTDVRVAGGITIRIGKGDEASTSQPASCALTLDNTTGAYSLGGMSSNWPHVRRGTPVRASVDLGDGDGFQTLFQGNADGWSPGWSTDAVDATVTLSASGVLRRLAQGDAPVMSPMRRSIGTSTNVVAYWPCEDGPNAQNIAAEIGPYPMTFYSAEHPGGNAGAAVVPPELGASDAFLCSDPLLKLAGAELYGHVGDYTDTGAVQVRALVEFPDGGATNETVLMGLATTGRSELWEVRYKTGGDLNIRGWSRGSMIVDQTINYEVDGRRGQLGLQLSQDGSDIDWRVDFLGDDRDGISEFYASTVAGYTFGKVTRVQLNTDGGNEDVVMGHVALYNAAVSIWSNEDELMAFRGDWDAAEGEGRLWRLCEENAIPLAMFGDGTLVAWTDRMGPQPRANLVALLREVETLDHGLLYDGHGPGLTYLTKRFRESRPARLTVDAAELAPPFAPVDDDQATCNEFTASRSGGGGWTHTDTDGPMGTEAIGRYDDTGTYNAHLDEVLPHFAAWAVAQGTVAGYRYPQLTVDVAKVADRAADVLALRPTHRVDITGLHAIRSDVPAADIRLAVEGYTMQLDSHRWLLTVNASPFERWAVGKLEADDADPQVAGEFPIILDTDGAELASGVSAGATSLSVATPSGPLWTTAAADMPLTIELGGVPVEVSAVSGASSPQTFTCAALPRAFAAGAAVKVWRPAMLGL